MSWHPNDLVSDVDLVGYEADILTQFGRTDWEAKRTKALEDWLFPILKGRGFDPIRLTTRFESDGVQAHTGSAYADKSNAAKSTSEQDVDLAAIFATAGTDALYVGSTSPFRGLSVHITDNPSSASSVLSVAYWNGVWTDLTVVDATERTRGKTLSGGGSVLWAMPLEWTTRKVNGIGPFFWVKVTVSATPTGAKAHQIGVVRPSSLRAPATLRTLQLIFAEAPTGADGPWDEKVRFYGEEAETAKERALVICGSEFDTDESELISPEEAGQTPEEAGGGAWTLERG